MEFLVTLGKTITGNYYINVAVVTWFLAQLLKTVLTYVVQGKIVWERMVGAGGMPSSHSALVCSLTVAIARGMGFASPEFAIAFVVAGVVMYDAMGVRRAAGEQAKVLNKLVFGFRASIEESESTEDDETLEKLPDKSLKEFLGHTPLEVLGGALLGILVAMVMPAR
ncbi:MAG: divergent PAP2 family protein [Oscillospiraceae bacterium]|nr:divergent PAP2 family protein [Oscillospiraceae bacterium]